MRVWCRSWVSRNNAPNHWGTANPKYPIRKSIVSKKQQFMINRLKKSGRCVNKN
jgi:hypothetical protein